MGQEEILREFLESQRLDRGASDHTIEAYRRDLTHFLDSKWAEKGALVVSDVDLNDYFNALASEGYQASSISRHMSAVRQFFKFLCLEKGLENNPAERIESPKKQDQVPKALSLEEVQDLLSFVQTGLDYRGEVAPALKARDRAMVTLLYATGMRVSELLGLTTNDIDLPSNSLKALGKGQKQRVVPFAPLAGDVLESYLKDSRPFLNPQTAHLFLNSKGFALTRQAFWKTLKKLVLGAGIDRNVSPHSLRHSFATHLLQSGMNLRSLQVLMGHSDLSSTQIYTQVTPDHLRRTHKKYHPMGED